MTPSRLFQYMQGLVGNGGCFITDKNGQLLDASMPASYDQAALEGIASNGLNLLTTLQSQMPSCLEVQLDMETKTLYIKDMPDCLLVVLLNDQSEVYNIRVATNVVSRS